MRNFNTNQTRFLYVAGANKSNVEDLTTLSNLDIAAKSVLPAAGEDPVALYFVYKNADGLLTRSDTIDVKKIKSISKTAAADTAIPLMRQTVALDTSAVELDNSTLDNYVGMSFLLKVTSHQTLSYDDNDAETVIAPVVITPGMAVADFHKALAIILKKMQKKGAYPYFDVYAVAGSTYTKITDAIAAKYTVTANGAVVLKTGETDTTSAANGIAIYQTGQKYVQGKLSNEPLPFSLSVAVSGGSNFAYLAWATFGDLEKSGSSISGTYALADLENFAAGEKGDYVRGSTWPNDYPFKSAIDLTASYDVLNIEYFWSGNAENVQKSPRLIQIAGPAAVITAVKGVVDGIVNPE